MEDKLSLKFAPRILLFSKPSDLSIKLGNRLLSLGCNLFVFSEESQTWEKLSTQAGNLKFLGDKEKILSLKPDYLIYIGGGNLRGLLNKINFRKKINLIKNLLRKNHPKILFVFPFLQNLDIREEIEEVIKIKKEVDVHLLGTVYLGDVIGDNNFILEGFLKKALVSKRIEGFPSSFVFNPISTQEAAEYLVKSLFSLGSWGKSSALIGRPVLMRDLVRILKKVDPQIELVLRKKGGDLPTRPLVDFKIYSSKSQKTLVLEYYKSLFGKKYKITLKNPNVFKSPIRLPSFRRSKKISIFLLILLLLLFFLPFLSFFLGNIFFISAEISFSKDLPTTAKVLTTIAKLGFKFDEGSTKVFSRLPLVGEVYSEFSQITDPFKYKVRSLERIVRITDLTLESVENIFSKDRNLDLDSLEEISLELNLLYNDLLLLEGEKSNVEFILQKIDSFWGLKPLPSWREKLPMLSEMFALMPKVLGKDTPKKYAFILEDVQFLRPTGGMIRLIYIVTVSGGKIVEIKSYPAYLLDRNFIGKQTPPYPLEVFIGKETWFLRDYNWDPDFNFSAQHIEKFIQRELGISVDGVISFDTEFIKSLLDILGEVKVDDNFVDSQSFYKFIEVSITDYPNLNNEPLLEITNEVIRRLFNLRDKRLMLKILKTVYHALDRKNLQISLFSSREGEILRRMYWDGSLDFIRNCQENCFNDFLAIVEVSNIPQSDKILKEGELDLLLEEGFLKRTLTIYFNNSTPLPYKSYLRIFVPQESSFSPPEFVTLGKTEKKDFATYGLRRFKETAVFIEIPPSEASAVRFVWESYIKDFTNLKDYELFIRKQAGIIPYPLKITFNPLANQRVLLGSLGLTQDDSLVYNSSERSSYSTFLTSDKLLRISFSHNE